MLQFNDIFAFIEVDGQELPQYGIDIIPEKNTVTCWVASQPDKHFSLIYGHTRQNGTFDINITTDGLLYAKLLRCAGRNTVIGVPTSPTSVRPYMFSKLQLTDEDKYLNKESSQMGEIRLDFYRCVVLEKSTTKRYDVCEPKGKVHERAKKALSHCVSLGREVSRSTTYYYKTERLDATPLASFIFRYREHSILRANGIILQPMEDKRTAQSREEGQNPSLHAEKKNKPTSLPQDVLDLTIENVTDAKTEDIKSLDAAIQALQRKRAALEAPSASTSQPPAKRIKQESTFVTKGEVIDLTCI